ncbi:MAG TPA: DUF2510 domain-containing protein [Galbitalea sp.]
MTTESDKLAAIPKAVFSLSQTSASGAGGSAAAGWYTDPHDPRQLRWWSGDAWTEHTSPAVAAQVEQTTVQQQVQQQPVEQQQPVQQTVAAAFGEAALPSRRALRDVSTEFDVPAQATAEPEVENYWNQPAEQVHSPLTPENNAWNQPVAAQPQAAQPQLVEPAVSQPAWGQPVQLTQVTQSWSQSDASPLSVVPATTDDATAATADGIDALFGSVPLPLQSAPASSAPVASVPSSTQSLWSPATTSSAVTGAPSAAVGVTAGLGDGAAGQWGLTPSTRDGEARARAPKPEGWSTIWVWLISISPLLAGGAIGYVLKTSGFTFGGYLLQVALVAPYLLVLLFAVADRSGLSRMGFEKPASWSFAALTAPIYLLARSSVTRREIAAGSAPLVVWFVSLLLAVGAIVGYGVFAHHALLPGLPS